jgi:hypothetical protein
MIRAAEPAAPFDAVLDRLRSESVRHFASSRVTLERGRLFVRPFSQVLEVRVRGGERAVTAFVKVLKPRLAGPQELEATRRNIAREFETTAKLHGGFGAHAGLSTARPIACYPELLAMVTERVDGMALGLLLARAGGLPSGATVDRLSGVMQRVGAWLRTFQAMDAPDGSVSLDRMRQYLDDRLRPLADGGVIDGDTRGALLRYFDRRAADVPSSELAAVPVHADFTPENVMIRDGSVSVLDFTMAKRGARYLDVAHMFMQVRSLEARPWFRPRTLDRLTRALLDGFDPDLSSDRPLFDLLLVQHVVCHLRQLQLEPQPLRARLYAALLRRRHVRWLDARR